VGMQAPEPLDQAVTFTSRGTWPRVQGFDKLGASIGVYTIEIEDPKLKPGNVGVLLDIDVFNLREVDAPTMDQVVDWFNRAHRAENFIFEASVTDSLRRTFQ
jgi:uncharacterized protein (TIGR04255 family)